MPNWEFVEPHTLRDMDKDVTYTMAIDGTLFIRTPVGDTHMNAEVSQFLYDVMFSECAAQYGLTAKASVNDIKAAMKRGKLKLRKAPTKVVTE